MFAVSPRRSTGVERDAAPSALPRLACFPAILALLAASSVSLAADRPPTTRPLAPTPAVSLADDDATGALAAGIRPRPGGRPRVPIDGARPPAARPPAPHGGRDLDEIGGDDIPLANDSVGMTLPRTAIGEDGIIFAAVNLVDSSTNDYWIMVYRSTDGGTTFAEWGQIGAPGGGGFAVWELTDLDVAGGATPRVFVSFSERNTANEGGKVAYADPAAPAASWTVVNVLPNPHPLEVRSVRLTTDAAAWNSYYVYVAMCVDDLASEDIWFARSTDQGATWSAPYMIGEVSGASALGYLDPHIAYGYDGVVHVAWLYTDVFGSSIDDAVRYRRAVDYAGGPSSWQPGPVAITTHTDGLFQNPTDLVASLDDPTVLLAYAQASDDFDPLLRVSTDNGATWPLAQSTELPFLRKAELEYRLGHDQFVAVGEDQARIALSRAMLGSELSWSAPQHFGDADAFAFGADVAIDPSRDARVAVVFDAGLATRFDAEWRGDPGYPNLEPGFPLPLAAPPASPPAVVDLDGDGTLEIVWSDQLGNVQAVGHDGAPVPGWPVNLGAPLAGGPVAVGALDLSGEPYVVVGTADARVYALAPDGSVRPGFPYQIPGESAPAYVSIGAIGRFYPRTIVAGAGDTVAFVNYRGSEPPGAAPLDMSGNMISAPAAIGDVDGDQRADVVVAAGTFAVAAALDDTGPRFIYARNLPYAITDAPTLGDVDGDGKLEAVVPTSAGRLYVLDESGNTEPGWPFVAASESALTAAAIGQILGTALPEIAVAARDWNLHLLYGTGAEQGGYPVIAGEGWYLFQPPVMGGVEGFSADLVIGSRGGEAYAFDNFGGLIPGWPKDLGITNQVQLTPAMGDLDLDGRNEIAILGPAELIVVDVRQPPADARSTWAMYGHDPARTGCADCPEDLVTSAPDDAGGSGETRVSFQGAWPNPASGPATFAYAVPVRARASLEIFDVRGRRVATVVRAEIPAGQHEIRWDRRDRSGREVPSGQYFARLSLRGPGLNHTETRSLMLVR